MLIVADGEDVRDLLPADERIRLIHLSESRSIGEKRNYGCERSIGEIVCHWDDDDYSAPQRIEKQVELLLSSGRAVVGFHSMLFTDGERWWRYRGARDYALGTSLCYLRSYWQSMKFPPRNIGEDNQFVTDARILEQLASTDSEHLMYATIHPGNTSPRSLGNDWTLLS